MRGLIALALGAGAVTWLVRSARRWSVRDRLRLHAAPKRLPLPLRDRVVALLAPAAIDMEPEDAAQIFVAAVLVAGFLGFALGGSVAPGIGAAGAVLVAAPATLHAMRGRRNRLVAIAVPVAIDRVASELRAGGTIVTALDAIANSDSVLAADLTRVQSRTSLGASLPSALHAWSSETTAPGVDTAAGAFAACAALGGRAADALDGLAVSLRDRLAVAAEARAMSAQARMSAVVVAGLPLCSLVWSAIVDQGALHTLTGTLAGRACLGAGLGLDAFGIWWMRRILRAGSLL